MTTQLTKYGGVPNAMEFINSTGEMIAKSKLAGCETVEQGKFFAMTCLGRGCDPMYLAQRFDVIKGNLRMKSIVMLASLRRLGGKHRVIHRTAEVAEVELSYDGQTERFSLTWEEAQEEDFTQGKKEGEIKANYNTPRKRMQMLWNRVISDGVSVVCPEVLDGIDHIDSIDAISSGDVSSVGSVIAPTEPPANASATTTVNSSTVLDSTAKPTVASNKTETAVDAEFVPAKESAATAEMVDMVAEKMSERITDAATNEHRTKVVGLMGELKQMGVSDIGARVKAKLAENGLGAITDLTISEAEALIVALEIKEIERFFELSIEGHVKANQGNE